MQQQALEHYLGKMKKKIYLYEGEKIETYQIPVLGEVRIVKEEKGLVACNLYLGRIEGNGIESTKELNSKVYLESTRYLTREMNLEKKKIENKKNLVFKIESAIEEIKNLKNKSKEI